MNAFIYQAALYCEDCAGHIRQRLAREGYQVRAEEDSDSYPCGPFANGGGEADSPQHCDACHAFLENPLTSEGVGYALPLILAAYDPADDSKWKAGRYSDHVADCLAADGESNLATWARFYEMPDAPESEND